MMENQNISFRIEGIELLEYSLSSFTGKTGQQSEYRFDLNIEHRFNLKDERVFVVVSVGIFPKDSEEREGNAKVSCIYSIKEISKYLKEGVMTFPQDFYDMLNSISLSTSRGVIFTLFKGTHLHNVIMPIINPAEFQKTEKDK